MNYRTNLKTIAKKVFFIRYEDLLADPESIIKKILPNNTNANFINCIEGVSPGTKKDYNIAYDYYLNEKWKEFYMGRVDTLEYINQHLDRKLMLEMGYKIFKK